eukprot:3536254-Prymnesium_polylepis.1
MTSSWHLQVGCHRRPAADAPVGGTAAHTPVGRPAARSRGDRPPFIELRSCAGPNNRSILERCLVAPQSFDNGPPARAAQTVAGQFGDLRRGVAVALFL